MSRRSSRRALVFVEALTRIAHAKSLEAGLRVDQAASLAAAITRQLCDEFNRQYVYIPIDLMLQDKLDERDQRIWDDYGRDGPDGARRYTAARVAQLAEAYDLSGVQVYAIVRAWMHREIAKRQGALDLAAPEDSTTGTIRSA